MQEGRAGTADETKLVVLNPKKKILFALTDEIGLGHTTQLFKLALHDHDRMYSYDCIHHVAGGQGRNSR